CRANRDRKGHGRARRPHRREDRARHPHVDGRWGSARSRLRAAQRPGDTGRPAVAWISGTADGCGLPESSADAMRHASTGLLLCRHAASGPPRVPAVPRGESVPARVGHAVAGQASGAECCRRRCLDVAGDLGRRTGTLAALVLRRRSHRPAARGRGPSRFEPVPQAGQGLSAVWLPRPGAAGDHATRHHQALRPPVRRQLLYRALFDLAGVPPIPGRADRVELRHRGVAGEPQPVFRGHRHDGRRRAGDHQRRGLEHFLLRDTRVDRAAQLPGQRRHLFARWVGVLIVSLLELAGLAVYDVAGHVATAGLLAAGLLVSALYFALVERCVAGFRSLEPTYCSIYDSRFWVHERLWKVPALDYLHSFDGTAYKAFIWRLMGVRIGRRVFDDGVHIPERTLVAIGD